ncbi:hypothetical protein SAMN03159288_04680 [Rhizobium sp. NFACC06-2]|nr:hypothetical protein SAMN03159288_04680 [Rhizobium sp. NFACC06-2]
MRRTSGRRFAVDGMVFGMIHSAISISNHLEIGDPVAHEALLGFSDTVLQRAGRIKQRKTVVLVNMP